MSLMLAEEDLETVVLRIHSALGPEAKGGGHGLLRGEESGAGAPEANGEGHGVGGEDLVVA
jgi:hypothetical protein